MTVYGAPWCPHCKRVKKFLAAHRVRYTFVDIDTDPQAIARLKELQNGGQIIPTVVYQDGTHEVNPSDEALARRIGLTLKAERSAYDLVIIGGGPAGLAAAIYAAREGIDIVISGALVACHTCSPAQTMQAAVARTWVRPRNDSNCARASARFRGLSNHSSLATRI